MRFVTPNSNVIVHAKTKLDALKSIARVFEYPDYKIYWEGNNPYMIPFVQSKKVWKVYAFHSKMGKACIEKNTKWAV